MKKLLALGIVILAALTSRAQSTNTIPGLPTIPGPFQVLANDIFGDAGTNVLFDVGPNYNEHYWGVTLDLGVQTPLTNAVVGQAISFAGVELLYTAKKWNAAALTLNYGQVFTWHGMVFHPYAILGPLYAFGNAGADLNTQIGTISGGGADLIFVLNSKGTLQFRIGGRSTILSTGGKPIYSVLPGINFTW